MELDELRRYVALRRRQRELDAQIEGLKEEANALEEKLLVDFEQWGVDRITVDGRTVYLQRQLWAGRADEVDRDAVVQALNDADLGQFVSRTYNSNTLSAYVRELDAAGEPLPPELASVIKVSEVFHLGVRKAD